MDLSNSSNACPKVEVEHALGWVNFSLAVMVMGLLTVVYRRARLCKQVFWGIPGIVTPVDLISHSANRTINILLFGAISGEILLALFQEHVHSYRNNDPYVNIFVQTVITPIVTVLEVCTMYFPLFASVDTPLPILGHGVGILYLPFLLSFVIYRDVALACVVDSFNMNVLTGLYIGGRLPAYIAFFLIVIWFIYALVRDVVYIHKLGFSQAMESLRGVNRNYEYYKKCVKHSLRPAGVRAMDSRLYQHCWLCPWLSSPRRLPLRLTSAVTVASIVLYQVCLLSGGVLLYLLTWINDFVVDRKYDILRWLQESFRVDYFSANNAYTIGRNTINFLMFALPVSPVVSMVMCLLLLAHLTISVYKNIQSASRGDLKISEKLPAFQLAASLRYAGYQIAFVLSAFVAYTLVLWTMGLIVVAFYVGFQYYSDWCWFIIASVLIPVGWIGVLVSGEVLACKLLFLKPGGGKFLLITNKKIFHWFGYILFVYNSIVGLFTAILRVIISAILGLVLMLRLDRVILMKGFEILDIGHNAYKGFLYVDHCHNNPVVHVFVRLLVEGSRDGRAATPLNYGHHNLINEPDEDLAHGIEEDGLLPLDLKDQRTYSPVPVKKGGSANMTGSRRVRNRWLVTYTMIRNPAVRRGHYPTVNQS